MRACVCVGGMLLWLLQGHPDLVRVTEAVWGCVGVDDRAFLKS